jgi:hypothetical protein
MSAVFCLTLLAWLFQHAMGLPDALRIVISAALIAPLAFFMGMPLPLGLARVEAIDARLIAWAWAINGCASVTGVSGGVDPLLFGGEDAVLPRAAEPARHQRQGLR